MTTCVYLWIANIMCFQTIEIMDVSVWQHKCLLVSWSMFFQKEVNFYARKAALKVAKCFVFPREDREEDCRMSANSW